MEFRRVFIYPLVLILSSCGGGGQTPTPEPPKPPEPTTYTIDLNWEPPLTFEDGTPIDPAVDIKEYRVYYGNDPNYLKQDGKLLIVQSGLATYATLWVPNGVWHLAVTTISVSDMESDLSNIVTYSFN